MDSHRQEREHKRVKWLHKNSYNAQNNQWPKISFPTSDSLFNLQLEYIHSVILSVTIALCREARIKMSESLFISLPVSLTYNNVSKKNSVTRSTLIFLFFFFCERGKGVGPKVTFFFVKKNVIYCNISF